MYEFISIMRVQFVVIHTVLSVEISASLGKVGYKHTFCENFVPPKKLLFLIFSLKNDILENLWRYFLPRVILYIVVLRQTSVSWTISCLCEIHDPKC
jgi:hypothetical protein